MRVLLIIACALSFTAPAIAKQSLEITPMMGYRFGGDFDASQDKIHHQISLTDDTSYGLLTAWSFDRERQGEFLISHYDTNFFEPNSSSISATGLGISYAHIGGNIRVSDSFLPVFVTGGFGLSYFAPEDKTLNDETRFSMNVGLATRFDLSEHISLRIDSRIYSTFFNSDSRIFCEIDSCAIYISNDMWFQSEVNAGITFSF
ncbi:outer membrane beta-barrel protein [Colwellia sp. E2M01]|uniref:outer membrane beta-barrel protein n=1 Tax=Colwellia sp. E2M01 TaxID=2841561 RepID=UPI001C0A0470|nr:outer membrane beta-barrel protein [Colwellia sp. E2M01]MBU2870100.1 porin family protein [Colwellia sp. E2M01]